MSSNLEIGLLPDDKCNRNGCTGVIEDHRDGQCSCHINPPCGYCTSNDYVCNVCGVNVADEIREEENAAKASQNKVVENGINSVKSWYEQEQERKAEQAKKDAERYALDDGSKYQVERYFDDIFEAVSAKDMTLGEAYKLRDELNARPRHYVYYTIKKQS